MIGLIALLALGTAQPAPSPAGSRLVLPLEVGQLVIYFPNGTEDGCSAEGQGAFAPFTATACASLQMGSSATAGRHGPRGGLIMEVGREASTPPFALPAGITLITDNVVEADVTPGGQVGACRVVRSVADPRAGGSTVGDLCADLHSDPHPFLPAAGSAAAGHGTVRVAVLIPAGAPPAAH